MDFRILGPLEVDEGGRALPLGGSTPRALLAALLLNANRVVSRSRLIEHVWGDDPPDTAGKMIQIYVSQLRKALGAAPGEVLVTRDPGYVLELDPERLDAARFERLVQRAREAVEPETAAATLREALALWRGPALGDLAELPFARAEAARLEELRLVAIEERIDAELGLGAHDALVAELEALVAEHPLRERLRSQLMLALYRSGRQAEALEAYQQARRLLVDELGIEPSRTLQLLERAVLQQDPSLDAPARLAEPTAAPPEPREARKTVSVVFAAVIHLGERLDPEALRRVMAPSTEVVAGVLERHGASVETRAGGVVMAVFGVPAVHEDDALRAVKAAVKVREAVGLLSEELAPKSQGRLAVRAGVSTSEVVAAGRLAVEGDSVHEAARLEQAAEPGEILIGRETERLVRDAVVTEVVDRSRLAWDGALEGTARRLLDVIDEPVPARRAITPMVGRERELAQLRDLFERAVAGRTASLCVLLGPAGIGKSRLAEEFAAVLDEEATVLSGRCLSYGEGITFWPLVQMVREAAGEASREALARLLADESDGALVADRVAAGIGLIEGAGTKEETFWAIRKLLEALARARPLVVVLDDVHWAEPTLLDLVEHLVDWLSGAPVLLLCLARPELLDDRPSWAGGRLNATSIRLAPLSERETEALVRHLPGTESLGKDEWSRIAEAAEGNPLFIHQMVAMLSEDGDRVGGELSVPPSIQALLAARLERLVPAERALLERASVVGKEFWRDALVELSPEDEQASIDERLSTLIRKELLSPGPAQVLVGGEGLRFRHLLIREAVYESIPKHARAELHERFAASLEHRAEGAGEFDEIVGYHFEQAYRYRAEVGVLGEAERELAEKAVDRLAAAGGRACARGDMRAGISLLTRAQSLVPETSVARAELLTELGEALREAGDLRRADEVLTEAMARASALREWAAEADAELLRLRLREQEGDPAATPDQIVRAGRRAIALFEELGDDRRLARAWLISAWAPWLQGRVVEAEKALERAIEHARRCGDERTEAQSLHLLVGAGFFGPSPVPEAERRCQEILAGMPEQQRIAASASRALAGLLAMEGDFDAARTLIEREKRILGELGLGTAAAIATQVYGLVELLAGDPAAAERELRTGYETLEKMGETSARPTIAAMLAEALAAQGRDDEALRFTEISEEAAAPDDLDPAVKWRAVRAKLLARRGELAEAERLAREAVALAEQTPDFLHLPADALTSLAEVLRIAGAPDEAAEAVGEALSLYELKGNRVSAGRARALLAELEAAASR